jgi:hypothetical protein
MKDGFFLTREECCLQGPGDKWNALLSSTDRSNVWENVIPESVDRLDIIAGILVCEFLEGFIVRYEKGRAHEGEPVEAFRVSLCQTSI